MNLLTNVLNKTLKVSTGLALALGMAQNVHAISLRFKFKTFSSGPSIYACNAGIRTPTMTKNVCYFEGTTDTCNPADCTNGRTCENRCVCSGSTGGDYLMNYFAGTHIDWKDNGVVGDTNPVRVTGNGNDAWKSMLSDEDSWKKTIKDLTFNLGSELYGAQYFVDVCYRGPQIEYFEDNVQANFSLRAQASATDFLASGAEDDDENEHGSVPSTVDGKKYTELAGLKVQSFIVCDQQGVGDFKNARNLNDEYNTTDTSAAFKVDSASGLPTGANDRSDLFSSSSSAFINASALDLFGGSLGTNWLNRNDTHTPRFCRVRYVFTESNAGQTSNVNLRKWQRHGAEVCTYTAIEEGDSI